MAGTRTLKSVRTRYYVIAKNVIRILFIRALLLHSIALNLSIQFYYHLLSIFDNQSYLAVDLEIAELY